MAGTKANMDIRMLALNSGVCHWEIAEKLGITEFSLSRKLRHEMPQDEKNRILNIINRIAESRNQEDSGEMIPDFHKVSSCANKANQKRMEVKQ